LFGKKLGALKKHLVVQHEEVENKNTFKQNDWRAYVMVTLHLFWHRSFLALPLVISARAPPLIGPPKDGPTCGAKGEEKQSLPGLLLTDSLTNEI
jgi:hypothetical protein